MKKQYVKRSDARQILRDSKGKFFSATFVKKDGKIRHMTCRVGVRKGVKGVGMSFNPKDHDLLTVFEPANDNFRMINLNTLLEATIDKTQYVFYTI